MTAPSILTSEDHPSRRVDHRADLVDRLIELRKALHGSIHEVTRLRRANAALRRDVDRLERELAAERAGHAAAA